jgi:hypothetical protein
MKALGRGSIASLVKIGLDILWVLFSIALGLVCVSALAYGVAAILTATGHLPPEILAGGNGDYKSSGVKAELSFDGLAPQVAIPALLSAAAACGGALIITGRLKRLFASFTSSTPFSRGNADHLRAIWMTMAGMELARYAIMALAGVLVAALGEPPGQDFTFKLNINMMAWGAILVLIVLAEVFREGARLREEEDLTI